MAALDHEGFAAAPRLGWVTDASPLEEAPRLAAAWGLEALWIKRDDQLQALYGGGKPRKLDYLLAREPLASAPRWAAAGAIGSGAMVALAAAAEQLGRSLDAHLFWTPPSDGVLDNLAFTASRADRLWFHDSRAALAVSRPAVLVGRMSRGAAVVPPGGTSPVGMLGFVRAGLELAAQLEERGAAPTRVYLPLGSGGSAVGLATGLALAGCDAEVVAVAVVERPLSSARRIAALTSSLHEELARWGLAPPPRPPRLTLERGHAGPAYGVTTADGVVACEALCDAGVTVEPIYGGKAAAALRQDAARGQVARAVFWHTARRGPLPHAPDWRERLPVALRRRLDDPRWERVRARRRVLLALGAGAAAAGVARVTGYEAPAFHGRVLGDVEALVLGAAAEALLEGASPAELAGIARRVDAYLTALPPAAVTEIHALLALLEHGTALGGRVRRFTSLSPADRERVVASLAARGGVLRDAARGVEDLCALGLYQQPSSWGALGYQGPMVGPGRRGGWPAYEAMRAPRGAVPKAATP